MQIAFKLITGTIIAVGVVLAIEARSTGRQQATAREAGAAVQGVAGCGPVGDVAPPRLTESRFTRTIATNLDFDGARSVWGDAMIEVHEVVWGITADGDVELSWLSGTAADGTPIEYKGTGTFARLAHSPDDLAGSYCKDFGSGDRILIEEVRFAVNSNRDIVVAYLRAVSSDGHAFELSNLFGVSCCAALSGYICGHGTCTDPNSCNGNSHTGCPCNDGIYGHLCTSQFGMICRGGCDGSEPQCKAGICNGNVEHCACQ